MNHHDYAQRGRPVATAADLGRLSLVNFDPALWFSAQPGWSRFVVGELGRGKGSVAKKPFAVTGEVLAECERQAKYAITHTSQQQENQR